MCEFIDLILKNRVDGRLRVNEHAESVMQGVPTNTRGLWREACNGATKLFLQFQECRANAAEVELVNEAE